MRIYVKFNRKKDIKISGIKFRKEDSLWMEIMNIRILNNSEESQDKSSTSDLTFITNKAGKKLKDRFEQLIKDYKFLDCLVAYFYFSGFHSIYKPLENTEKIRILIGIGTDKGTTDWMQVVQTQIRKLSHYEAKEAVEEIVVNEFDNSDDNQKTEKGIKKFIECLVDKKFQIRAYPSQNIHAKLYIMTFREGDRHVGRVITGSSNFTQAGLVDNLEFNVELKNRADYEYAKQKFEELWKDSVEVSEKLVQIINEKTWYNTNISPYELYLKFLYEYFKDELSKTDEVFTKYLPENFKLWIQ